MVGSAFSHLFFLPQTHISFLFSLSLSLHLSLSLSQACQDGNLDLVQWLLIHERADPSFISDDDDVTTPIAIARRIGHKKVWDTLDRSIGRLVQEMWRRMMANETKGFVQV